MQREGDAIDDYGGASRCIIGAFWPHFPLGRGLVAGRPISDLKFRHLFMYFDPHIAQDLEMLFCCADIKMRHAVNRAVSARVKSSREAFEQFELLVNDADFIGTLQAARKEPNGAIARLVTQRVLNVIHLAGRHVPHGNCERKAEVTKLMAQARTNGPPSGMRNLSRPTTCTKCGRSSSLPAMRARANGRRS